MTTITNDFTGYSATIRKANPTIATIIRHVRKSKAIDCLSTTHIEVDGRLMELADFGNGPVLIAR